MFPSQNPYCLALLCLSVRASFAENMEGEQKECSAGSNPPTFGESPGLTLGSDGSFREQAGEIISYWIEKPSENFEQRKTYHLPPGDYIIGDIAMFVSSQDIASAEPGQQDLGGLPCITGTTSVINTYFVASNGRHYSIRTTLGIMDARLADIPLPPLGDALEVSVRINATTSRLHRFASDVHVEIWKGVFKFSSKEMQLVIDTNPGEESDTEDTESSEA